MATKYITILPEEWKNINTELSLIDDTGYIIQNIGDGTARFVESSVEPTHKSGSHVLKKNEFQSIVPTSGLGWWISGENQAVTIVVTEAE